MSAYIDELRKRLLDAIKNEQWYGGRGYGLSEAIEVAEVMGHDGGETPNGPPPPSLPGAVASTSSTSDPRPGRIKRAMFDLLRQSGDKLTAREIVARLRKEGHDANFDTVLRGLTEAIDARFLGRVDGRYFAFKEERVEE